MQLFQFLQLPTTEEAHYRFFNTRYLVTVELAKEERLIVPQQFSQPNFSNFPGTNTSYQF